ncbi:flagellar biosynthesis, cell-distal portion of basal-body rod [Klebsiella pneumoniae]|nr:flagellar biosynthesis, cell-distal portion of basal-body rod [Klebsiella pneumoniae]
MAFNPELGSTSPAVLLDNAERLDKLVNGPELTEPDRAGVELDTWRGMMAKNDEIRQNLIPLSKQYATLAARKIYDRAIMASIKIKPVCPPLTLAHFIDKVPVISAIIAKANKIQ